MFFLVGPHYKDQNDYIDHYLLIRYIGPMSTFNNEKYALKPVICEGRQFSVICHVKAILEGYPK